MKTLTGLLAFPVILSSIACRAWAQPSAGADAPRMVLVELFTSQGCDMCPEAERLLGVLAARNARVIPVAFHVDYFNDPWVDPFSNKLYSQRQAAYNATYDKPKNDQYGLYYTPMVMVDGEESVNGRDAEGIERAVRRALARQPQVAFRADLVPGDSALSAEMHLKIESKSPRLQGRELLICAVLRDDGVVTAVESGENAHKTLSARFPARSTRFEFLKLEQAKEKSLSFDFRLDPAWSVNRLGIVVFAQDRKTGEIYQSTIVPWAKSDGDSSKNRPSSRLKR
jgi:hypothetical protein